MVEAAGVITNTVPSLVLGASTVSVAPCTATPDGPLSTVTVWVTVLVSPKHTYRCAGVGRLVSGCAPACRIVRGLTPESQLG